MEEGKKYEKEEEVQNKIYKFAKPKSSVEQEVAIDKDIIKI